MFNGFNDPILYVLSKMEGSVHKFYLTGSRYFGNACATSDYDFFVERSNEVISFLEELGFYSTTGYELTTYVFGGKIHVQIVDDAVKYRIVRSCLRDHPRLMETTKEVRSLVWNAMSDLFGRMETTNVRES